MFYQILLTNSLLQENVWGSIWRICKWIPGLQRLRTTEAFLLTGSLYLIHVPFIAWEKSLHFAMPPLVSLWNDVWETRAEISYWWHVTTQMWVVLLTDWKFASTNGISALVSQTSFSGETSGGVAKYRLFSQAITFIYLFQAILLMVHLLYIFYCYVNCLPGLILKILSSFARANRTRETSTEKFWPNNNLFLLGQNLSVKSINDAFYCV